MKPKIKLLLDSGAFSAWKKDATLDIKEYIQYIKRNQHLIHAYVNMDVIPGSMGRLVRTPQAVEKSARLSYENLQRMKDAGLSPIPVFHQGESFDWLERLIADGESYIGISPYSSARNNEIILWLDRSFAIVKKQKTHGFGIATAQAIMRYPWHTTDSTTWAVNSSFGSVRVPSLRAGNYDYTRPVNVRFSLQRELKSPVNAQFSTFGYAQKEYISQYLNSIGEDIFGVCNENESRRRVNIAFYQGLQNQCREAGNKTYNIVFATWLKNIQAMCLTKRNANFRLLSYFELKEANQEKLEHYIYNGYSSDNIQQPKNWNESYKVLRYASFIKRMKSEEQDAQD